MSPIMAYMGSESERLPCWLEVLDQQVTAGFEPDQMNGWGIGYFTGDRALCSKRPHTVKPWKFTQEIKNITSKVALWHILQKADRAPAPLDVQPFHFGRWLFACDGLPALQQEMRDDMPQYIAEHLLRNLKGQGAGEYLFYWLMQSLQKEGWLDHPPQQIKSFVDLIQQGIGKFAELFFPGGAFGQTAAVLTDGRIMFAFSRRPGMYISFKEGISSCSLCGHRLEEEFSLRESHNRSRAIFVISGLTPSGEGHGWQPLNPESVVAFDRDFSTHYFRRPL